MLTCPNCHAQIDDDALFCNSCGAKIEKLNHAVKYCPNCGHPSDFQNAFCENCGEPFPKEKEVLSRKSHLKKGLFFGGIGAAAVVVVSLFIIFLFSGDESEIIETKSSLTLEDIGDILEADSSYSDNVSEPDYTLYLKDNEIFFSDLSEDPWQLTSRFIDDWGELDNEDTSRYFSRFMNTCTYLQENGPFQMGPDGHTLFFPDKTDYNTDGFSLYYKNIKKPEEDAVKIASDIVSYQIDQDTSIVTYLKNNNTLYQYNIKANSDEKIESDIYVYHASDDGQKICYMTKDHSAYWAYSEDNKEKIASDITDIVYATEDLSTVYYTKEGALYKKEEGKDNVKISSDVSTILSIYESGEAYYLKKGEEKYSLMDYVNIDISVADASEHISKHSAESIRPAVANAKSSIAKASLTSFSWWRRHYENHQVEEAPAEAAAEPASSEEESPYDMEYDYSYNDAPSPEKLFEALNLNIITLHNYTLCYYDGEKETILSEYVTSRPSHYASDSPVISFTAYNPSDIEKINLSELIYDDVQNLMELYDKCNYMGYSFNQLSTAYNMSSQIEENHIQNAVDYIAIGDTITELDRNNESETPFFISKDGKTIYYTDHANMETMRGDLYKIMISGKKLGEPELYDTDVLPTQMQFISDDKFLYYKDYKDSICDLYINKTRIDSDVLCLLTCYDESENTLLYLSDPNTDMSSFTLNLYKDDSSERIADDVYAYIPLSGKNILYISDYSEKYLYGDLYLYQNKKKESILIDDAVSIIIDVYDLISSLSNSGNAVYIY